MTWRQVSFDYQLILEFIWRQIQHSFWYRIQGLYLTNCTWRLFEFPMHYMQNSYAKCLIVTVYIAMYLAYDYLSMMGLKLIHVTKRDRWRKSIMWVESKPQESPTTLSVLLITHIRIICTCFFLQVTSKSSFSGMADVMMTSSSGSIFGVSGPLWGESTGDRWIPHSDFDATPLIMTPL